MAKERSCGECHNGEKKERPQQPRGAGMAHQMRIRAGRPTHVASRSSIAVDAVSPAARDRRPENINRPSRARRAPILPPSSTRTDPADPLVNVLAVLLFGFPEPRW